MKRIAAFVACIVLGTGLAHAAPVLDVDKGRTVLDTSYTAAQHSEKYYTYSGSTVTRKVDGYNTGYTLYYGFNNGTSGSLGLSNIRPKAFYDGLGDHYTTPNADVASFSVQRKIHDNAAMFVSYKYITGDWTYEKFSEGPAKTGKNDARHVAGVGLVGYKKASDSFGTYAKTGIGNGYQEYEVGFTFQSGSSTLKVGYNYQKIENLHNSLYATSSEMDLASSGVTVGFNYKF